MVKTIKSAWGVIYYVDEEWTYRFLLLKRHALSGKIERVAPKWKIQPWESEEKAALREVSEEAWIPLNFLKVRKKIWTAMITWLEDNNWKFEKEVTYFLMKYDWDPDLVDVQPVEWYLGVYKRANINELSNLIYYGDIRNLFRQGFNMLKEQKKKDDVKNDFMKKLEI